MLYRFWTIALVFAVGCGPINPDPPTDENGDEIVVLEAFDQPLGIESITPGAGSIHPQSDILITFDRYLSDDELIDFSAVQLVSGGRRVGGRSSIFITDRAIRFRPSNPMIEDLLYTLSLDPNQIFSETIAPLGDFDLPVYRSDSTVAQVQFSRTEPSWDDVKEIFVRKCDSCHSDPQWALVPMEFDALVGKKSDQVNRFLVRPFDPSDSYLMHKILPGYADRRFTIQPPPWAEAVSLTREERLTIEFWIVAGAQQTVDGNN